MTAPHDRQIRAALPALREALHREGRSFRDGQPRGNSHRNQGSGALLDQGDQPGYNPRMGTAVTETRPVVGFEYRYSVTSTGTVISRWRRRRNGAFYHQPVELRPSKHHRTRHLRVVLYDEAGKPHSLLVHAIVAAAWIGPSDSDLIRHLDGDPQNNAHTNLAYGTHTENCFDRKQHRLERLFFAPEWWEDIVARFNSQRAAGTTFAGLDHNE